MSNSEIIIKVDSEESNNNITLLYIQLFWMKTHGSNSNLLGIFKYTFIIKVILLYIYIYFLYINCPSAILYINFQDRLYLVRELDCKD